MTVLQSVVQHAILDEFRRIDEASGVLAAVEQRYQRSQIQFSAHRYETQIHAGERPIVGVNLYRTDAESNGVVRVVRTPGQRQRFQVARLKAFKKRHAKGASAALDRLAGVVRDGGNVFEELVRTVEDCSLGQITARLQELVGRFRPTV
jgi:methylmalonyl-CoA mutase